MAENVEVLGRKIFFVNPPYVLKKDVIPALQAKEYEIYTLDSVKEAKNVFRALPDLLVFITPDNQLSVKGWFNFIMSCYDDEKIKGIKIGLIGKNIKDQEKELFLSKGKLELGCINTDKDEKLEPELESVFELNNAKGRRQYVRVNCLDDRDAEVFWQTDDKLHKFTIVDLSSAAIAVKASLYVGPYLRPDAQLHNLMLLLEGRQYPFDASIYMIKPMGEFIMVILFLKKSTGTATLEAIRKYVGEHLEKQLMAAGYSETKDPTVYSALPYYDEATGKTSDHKDDKKSKAELDGEKEQEAAASDNGEKPAEEKTSDEKAEQPSDNAAEKSPDSPEAKE